MTWKKASESDMLTYGVIADGSLRVALEKGEIKERYWNPGDRP